MASLLFGATAAGLPSARPRHDGGGMLTGLRVGTAGQYDLRLALSSTVSPREVKVACFPVVIDDSSLGPYGDDYEFDYNAPRPRPLAVSEDEYAVSDRMEDEDEFDHFFRVLSEKSDMLLGQFTPKPLAVSEEEKKAVQEKFKEMANKCIDLSDATRRIRPVEKRRTLFPMFGDVYSVFALARWSAEREGVNWWVALQIIEKLKVVRKMVSSACGGTSLPFNRDMVFDRKVALTRLDCKALMGHGADSNLSVVIFVLMENVYSTVKSDVDDMISASTQA